MAAKHEKGARPPVRPGILPQLIGYRLRLAQQALFRDFASSVGELSPGQAGILLLIRSRTPGRDRDSLIDSLIIAIGLGLLSWEFLMAPYARDHTLTAMVKIVSIAYPLMDMILLAVVVRLTVGMGHRPRSFYLLVFKTSTC